MINLNGFLNHQKQVYKTTEPRQPNDNISDLKHYITKLTLENINVFRNEINTDNSKKELANLQIIDAKFGEFKNDIMVNLAKEIKEDLIKEIKEDLLKEIKEDLIKEIKDIMNDEYKNIKSNISKLFPKPEQIIKENPLQSNTQNVVNENINKELNNKTIQQSLPAHTISQIQKINHPQPLLKNKLKDNSNLPYQDTVSKLKETNELSSQNNTDVTKPIITETKPQNKPKVVITNDMIANKEGYKTMLEISSKNIKPVVSIVDLQSKINSSFIKQNIKSNHYQNNEILSQTTTDNNNNNNNNCETISENELNPPNNIEEKIKIDEFKEKTTNEETNQSKKKNKKKKN